MKRSLLSVAASAAGVLACAGVAPAAATLYLGWQRQPELHGQLGHYQRELGYHRWRFS